MFKRMRHFNRIFALKLFVFTLSLFCMLLCGCSYYSSESIPNYNEFLFNYEKYSNDDTVSDIVNEEIPGFVPLSSNDFDFGKILNGKAFVKKNNLNYILNVDGSLINIEDDLSNIEIIDDKYVFESDNKKGVKDIFGNIILSAGYESVFIKDSIMLAMDGECVKVFADGKLKGQSYDVAKVAILSEDCLLVDNIICGLDFVPLKACGYPYIDIPREGIVKVKTGGRYIGYVRLSDNKMIGGKYIKAQNFSESTAVVMLEDGNNAVIDTDGNILFQSSDRIIESKYGNYYCYAKNNMFGVMNSDFEDTVEPMFSDVKNRKVFDEYLIVPYSTGERLYSVKSGKYVANVYDKINYADGLFFAISGNKTSILNADLNILTELNNYDYKNGILSIYNGGKSRYYSLK